MKKSTKKLLKKYDLETRNGLEAQEALNIIEDHFLGSKVPYVDWATNYSGNLILVKFLFDHYPHPRFRKKKRIKISLS